MPTTLLPRTRAATGIALINSLGNTGGLFGPYLIGLLRTSTGGFRRLSCSRNSKRSFDSSPSGRILIS